MGDMSRSNMRLVILLLGSLQFALVPTAVFSAQTIVGDDSIRKPVPIRTSLPFFFNTSLSRQIK